MDVSSNKINGIIIIIITLRILTPKGNNRARESLKGKYMDSPAIKEAIIWMEQSHQIWQNVQRHDNGIHANYISGFQK